MLYFKVYFKKVLGLIGNLKSQLEYGFFLFFQIRFEPSKLSTTKCHVQLSTYYTNVAICCNNIYKLKNLSCHITCGRQLICVLSKFSKGFDSTILTIQMSHYCELSHILSCNFHLLVQKYFLLVSSCGFGLVVKRK